ncbi:MAG: TetR/AcrR family transcriptional regulator [Mycobacterium sp.]
MDRRVEKGKATRDVLMSAARSLFGEHGYDGTSIDAILQASGVARGALYHHFATKEALFDAVLEREVATIAAAAAEAARAASDPVASLRAGCATWLRHALDPAVQRIALLDSPAVVGWTRWREIDEQHTLGRLRANVKRIADDGTIPADQVDVLTNMVLAAVAEVALVIARDDDPDAALETGLQALDTLLTRVFAAGEDHGRSTGRRE